MTVGSLDRINILLMLLSAAIAFYMPFELFLLAYAILGPLHYLTEIHWLKKSNFYIQHPQEIWWLVLLSIAITFAAWVTRSKPIRDFSDDLVMMAFISAAGMVFIRKGYLRIVWLVIAFFAIRLFSDNYFYLMLFGVFLPTLIHVYVFTGLFILYGALKSRSVSGLISLAVFVGCGIFLFFAGNFQTIWVSNYGQNAYELFRNVNDLILHYWNPSRFNEMKDTGSKYLFEAPESLALTRFIAFAYTYHYLNWFSKTSVIRWHEMPRKYMIGIGILWLISVTLYLADYLTGLKWLYLLSMLHVFLEFPLNFRTMSGIGKEIKTRWA